MAVAAADGLPVSAPLLDGPEDFRWMAGLLGRIAEAEGRTLLVMGHGTDHAADETYAHFVDSARNGVIVITLKQPGTYTPSRKKAKAIYVH